MQMIKSINTETNEQLRHSSFVSLSSPLFIIDMLEMFLMKIEFLIYRHIGSKYLYNQILFLNSAWKIPKCNGKTT